MPYTLKQSRHLTHELYFGSRLVGCFVCGRTARALLAVLNR